jgi:hypothetical protein
MLTQGHLETVASRGVLCGAECSAISINTQIMRCHFLEARGDHERKR